MKTVIIEDDSLSQLLLNRVLSGRNHEVHIFRTAEEAMSACHREFFPLMILDLDLPGMCGLEFCIWVRTEPCGAPPYVRCAPGRDRP